MRKPEGPRPHATSFRSPFHSVRNPTTWFQLLVIRDAGPEITSGLGAFIVFGVIKASLLRAFLAFTLLRETDER